MKDYHETKRPFGYSDIARLTAVGPREANFIEFGRDGGYFSNYKELEKNDILNDINDYILEAIDHHEEEQARQEALRKEFYHD